MSAGRNPASLELLDANRKPVANASLTADSGTLYPLDGLPEPGSVLLVTLGLAAMLVRSGRARREEA